MLKYRCRILFTIRSRYENQRDLMTMERIQKWGITDVCYHA